MREKRASRGKGERTGYPLAPRTRIRMLGVVGIGEEAKKGEGEEEVMAEEEDPR